MFEWSFVKSAAEKPGSSTWRTAHGSTVAKSCLCDSTRARSFEVLAIERRRRDARMMREGQRRLYPIDRSTGGDRGETWRRDYFDAYANARLVEIGINASRGDGVAN